MKKLALSLLALVVLAINVQSQSVNQRSLPEIHKINHRTFIQVPDLDGYKTLKCDFHMHSMFSDGTVWPTIRLDEAWMEGLDAISLTEHVEWGPYREYIEGDDNSSWNIISAQAQKYNLILVRATEITRSMPPGHLNALFIDDANKMDVKDWNDAMQEAQNQGAFVMWNHPGWRAQQPDTCKMFPIHEEWIKKGWIHGVEVSNEIEWYPIAVDWCADHNLAAIGNTDIHGVVSHKFNLEEYHRPMTLVFAKEKSQDALKEAMFARRTVAWFSKYVAGPEKLLKELFEKSVSTETIAQINGKPVTKIELSNPTDFTFEFVAKTDGLPSFTLAPQSVYLLNLKGEPMGDLEYEIGNWFVRTEQALEVRLKY